MTGNHLGVLYHQQLSHDGMADQFCCLVTKSKKIVKGLHVEFDSWFNRLVNEYQFARSFHLVESNFESVFQATDLRFRKT